MNSFRLGPSWEGNSGHVWRFSPQILQIFVSQMYFRLGVWTTFVCLKVSVYYCFPWTAPIHVRFKPQDLHSWCVQKSGLNRFVFQGIWLMFPDPARKSAGDVFCSKSVKRFNWYIVPTGRQRIFMQRYIEFFWFSLSSYTSDLVQYVVFVAFSFLSWVHPAWPRFHSPLGNANLAVLKKRTNFFLPCRPTS